MIPPYCLPRRRHGGLAMIAAVLLLLVGAGAMAGSHDRAVAVLSIEGISVDGPPRITDITAQDAVLRVQSSVALACSVVYGETGAFGMIATDIDMAGGAHSDHHPVLAGLKPDTEYSYRVQGTAADGRLFMSATRTFRTPARKAAEAVNLGSLAAGARVAGVSSNYGGAGNDSSFGAHMALDGSNRTAWSSFGDGDDAFIDIAFAGPARIDAVEVWTRTMANGTAQIFSFTLTTDSGEVLGPFDLPDASRAYRFEVDITSRSLRLDVVSSNGGNTGLVEFAAFGALL